MQPFRVSNDAKVWFRHLRRNAALQTDFDILYFCFIAGIISNRQRDLTHDETSELTVSFPDSYKAKSRLLVGLFLKAKLDDLGTSLSERAQVHEDISNFVAPDSPNHMSATGVKEFCRYSHGGFEVLRDDWFENEPMKLETFLRKYKIKVDQICIGK